MAENNTDGNRWHEDWMTRIKDFAADAQTRRLRVRGRDGKVAVDVPLPVGAIAGGAVVIAAPVLAVIGAVAAFASKVSVEISQEEPSSTTKAADPSQDATS